jgi:hypothetical protein
MSNGKQEWGRFMEMTETAPLRPEIRLANGAVSGNPAQDWADPNDDAWDIAISNITAAGLSLDEVQVAWVKHGSQMGQLTGSFETNVELESAWIRQAIEIAADRFPNLRRVYVSSRIYAGYEASENHEEPFTGYDNGFSVKEVVLDSVSGDLGVWVAWGPYLWADGTSGRSDGLTWLCSDFVEDGVHPSSSGEDKVASALLDFFSTDPGVCPWFVTTCGEPGPPPPPSSDPCPLRARCDSVVVVAADGQWHVRERLEAGAPVSSFYFGNPGDIPFVGDWDGDGVATPGLYRQSDGFVYLRNSNTEGVADTEFFFGNPGDVPIIGDFDNDGDDTVGIYRPGEGQFYIINELGADQGGLGAADFSFFYGNPGDVPFVGDFDGDGIDTVGLYRQSTGFAYLRNTLTQGTADLAFFYGNPGDIIMAGDWDGDGNDTVGIYRPTDGTIYLNDQNTQANATYTLTVGTYPNAAAGHF